MHAWKKFIRDTTCLFAKTAPELVGLLLSSSRSVVPTQTEPDADAVLIDTGTDSILISEPSD